MALILTLERTTVYSNYIHSIIFYKNFYYYFPTGAIRKLEEKLNRPLQWIICLLHFNELPLKTIFQEIDGTTKGPTVFSGPIGKKIASCEKMPVVEFEKINTTDMPILRKEVVEDLSNDQKYLYEIIDCIQKGACRAEISAKKPGPLNHARFLTLANRILRLYVASSNPSNSLKFLTQYVVKVYGPMWFLIKLNPQLSEGPRHLFKFTTFLNSLQNMPQKYLALLRQSVNRNSYFGHPENVLLSMLVDNHIEVRRRAVKLILKKRLEPTTKIRIFQKPDINFNAKKYEDIIDLDNIEIFEPPVCKFFTDSEIITCIDKKDNLVSKAIKGIPNHSQAVERAVKLVTTASSKVSGEDARNGVILNKLAFNNAVKEKNTKKDFIEFAERDNIF